jgi:hypothetical protein
MTMFQLLLVPLAGLLGMVGVLIGGQVGKVLLVLAAAGFGAACIVVLATA